MTEVVGKSSAVSTGEEPRESEPHVVFHVTGFGAFAGMRDNPTTHLIGALPAALGARGIRCVGGIGFEPGKHESGTTTEGSEPAAAFQVQTAAVLHVSAQKGGHEVREIHRRIDEAIGRGSGPGAGTGNDHTEASGRDSLANGDAGGVGAGPCDLDRGTHVLVHCGVDGGSTKFKLETLGYNEATFRVSDETGYKPYQCPVDDTNLDISHALKTTLPIARIRNRLSGMGWGEKFVLESTSAGRFVCNYVFYTSLNLCEAASSTPPLQAAGRGDETGPALKLMAPRHCLFLHVPEFRAISQERQMDFLIDCLSAIAKELRSGTSAANGAGVAPGPSNTDSPLLPSPPPSPSPSGLSRSESLRKGSFTSIPLHVQGRSFDGANSSIWGKSPSEGDFPSYHRPPIPDQHGDMDGEAFPLENGDKRLETAMEATRRALVEAGFEEPDVDAAMATTGSDNVEVNMQCLIDVMPLLPQGSPATGDVNELRRFLRSAVERRYVDSASPHPGYTPTRSYDRGQPYSGGIKTPRRTLGGVSPKWVSQGTPPSGRPGDGPSPSSRSSTEAPSPSTNGLLAKLRRHRKGLSSGEMASTGWGTVPRHHRELSKSSVTARQNPSRIARESPSPEYSRRTTGNSNLQSPSPPIVRHLGPSRRVEVTAGWGSVPGGSNLGLVMLVRLDLGMGQGAIAAQCSRAALAAARKAEGSGSLDNIAVWRDAGAPMVVLGARDAKELGGVLEVGATSGLPITIVREKGAAWSSDVVSVSKCTVAAIGPASISDIFAIAGVLPVL